jgi:hypothetical protein
MVLLCQIGLHYSSDILIGQYTDAADQAALSFPDCLFRLFLLLGLPVLIQLSFDVAVQRKFLMLWVAAGSRAAQLPERQRHMLVFVMMLFYVVATIAAVFMVHGFSLRPARIFLQICRNL